MYKNSKNMNSSSDEDESDTRKTKFNRFDESIEVRNAVEIDSPVMFRRNPGRKSASIPVAIDKSEIALYQKRSSSNRFSDGDGKSMTMGSDMSDSEDTDEDDIQGSSAAKPVELYDPKPFEDLPVSAEIKELFQNIMRYTPQKVDLSYKLIPFIPDYIPAVGDIDAFIKVPRPDDVEEKIGLTVLDEPSTVQSDPAVLHLQLRSRSRSAGATRQAVIKRIDDAEKDKKSIDKWIEDMNQLHRTKHPPTVRLTRSVPDVDLLMQQWPPEVEENLIEGELDLSKLDCDLNQCIDIACNLVDIPVYEDSRLEALHTLFLLYLEIRNIKVQEI